MNSATFRLLEMNRAKLQVDDIGDGFGRLSLGEFSEKFPESSVLVRVLGFLLDALGGWEPTRSVLVGHWSDETTTARWRRIASFPYRNSLIRTSTILLSEVPEQTALRDAVECGWRLPRLLLCVMERSSEGELVRLEPSQWRSVLEDEIPSVLLASGVSMVALGFYHQRWVSAYVPKVAVRGLVRDLLADFHHELVEVSDEL